MSFALFIPDFLQRFQTQGRPRLPGLELLAARGDAVPVRDANGFLAPRFSVKPAALTVAPLTRIADGGQAESGYWLRADPVHLAPDRDQLVLMSGALLEVGQREVSALAEAFNKLYSHDGWRLFMPHPLRGYLRCPRPLDVSTHDPETLAGRPVLDSMPGGADGPVLRQLMNETQMLFHEHTVNHMREELGRPCINSLWFWGGGSLPERPARAPQRVITDLPLVQGLTLWSGRNPELPAAHGLEDIEMDTTVASLLAFAGEDLRRLDSHWCAPLATLLRSGRLQELDIHLGGAGSYILRPGHTRRFWRRARPFAASP